jgi:hypothetical protein
MRKAWVIIPTPCSTRSKPARSPTPGLDLAERGEDGDVVAAGDELVATSAAIERCRSPAMRHGWFKRIVEGSRLGR